MAAISTLYSHTSHDLSSCKVALLTLLAVRACRNTASEHEQEYMSDYDTAAAGDGAAVDEAAGSSSSSSSKQQSSAAKGKQRSSTTTAATATATPSQGTKAKKREEHKVSTIYFTYISKTCYRGMYTQAVLLNVLVITASRQCPMRSDQNNRMRTWHYNSAVCIAVPEATYSAHSCKTPADHRALPTAFYCVL